MTIAVCIYCGEKKFGALNPCDSCGKIPSGMEDIARSMMLTDHYMSVESLEKAQRAVKQQYPWYDIPNIKAKIESFKRDCFTETGEYDTAKIMAACRANTAEPDSGEADSASASQHTGKQNKGGGGCSRKVDGQTKLVNAICIFCGAVKEDPLIECPSCHRQPKDLDAVSRSIVLSSETFDTDMLIRLQEVLKLGIDWTLGQNTQRRLHEWRTALADSNGELDLMKVVRYSQSRAHVRDTAKKPGDNNAPDDVIDLGLNSHDDQGEVQQSQLQKSRPSQEWSGWLKTVFSVLAFFAPTLGLFIGTFGMALRNNRRQCKSIWISSVVGFVLFGGYCSLGNAIVGNSLVSGLIAAGILIFGLLWTVTIYLSTRESVSAKLSAVVVAALILVGTLWLAASMSFLDELWKTKGQGHSTVAPVVSAPYAPAHPTLSRNPIAISSPTVPPIAAIDIDSSVLGAYRRKMVVPYFNDFMPAAARLELVAINRWVQILKSNTSVADAAVITEREIIPNWRNYMDFLQKNYPDGEELRSYHQQIIRIANMRMTAYQTFVRGARAQDERIIKDSAQQMQQIDVELGKIEIRTRELMTKYQIDSRTPQTSTSGS